MASIWNLLVGALLCLAGSVLGNVVENQNGLYEGNQQGRNKQQHPLLEDFDALGAWFDQVDSIKATTAPRRSNATIAIVGAGITGLTTALLLDSVGMHNWELVEASERVGGRFRTKFVGRTKEWAEMGPMRLPWRVTYKSDGSTHEYSEHAMVFQLADWLNELNANKPEDKIDFIPWIQHHANEGIARGTARHADGRVPTRGEIARDPSLGRMPPLKTAEYNETRKRVNDFLMNEQTLRDIQRDPWRAHRAAMDAGLDDWSLQALLRHVLGVDADVADAIWTASDYDVLWDEMVHNSNLGLDGGPGALGETQWLCVDGGFDRLSQAFVPHVRNRLKLGRKIKQVESIESQAARQQTRLTWCADAAPESGGSGTGRRCGAKVYDYTMMTVPFTMTRLMELPRFSSILTRAMSEAGLRFKSACKVALLFRQRFWERGPRPIYGGYSMPASLAVGALYYPSYGTNSSTPRPGLITHYRGGDWSDRFVSMTAEQHAQMALDAVVDLHGQEARRLYTGDYERLCWLQDEHAATAWCRPDVMQHRLYIPAYHRTEKNMIFMGEHTAPTHAWISSSLHSAVRGVVQLLLELGMPDEAKEVNGRWMGRWIGMHQPVRMKTIYEMQRGR
ncbi:hypothetical protein CDD81_6457 [Ophiocordyceps australis]|uniref:Amine oxidase domain-containing protein n=1 Tax=Ophiocordyceps australis TaxID=1399860 RepID=A0A2C5YGK9_9HYPO|nr:hypothetical protein CDD81_6457 [Ophiocordyceps australis]